MDLISIDSVLYLLLFITFTFLFNHFTQNPQNTPNTGPLTSYPLIGILPQFLRHRHRLLDWITDILLSTPTHTVGIVRPGNIKGILTANPSNVEHILKTNFDNYPKGPRFASLLGDFLGDGIFNSDGDLWRSQRKTASFEFNTRSLRGFVVSNVSDEVARRLLPALARAAERREVVDLQDLLERFAFDNVCRVAFGEDPACLSEERSAASAEFAKAFEDAANLSAGRFRYAIPIMWRVKKALHVGSERRLAEAIRIVHDFATRIIKTRKQENSASPDADLLSRFIASGVDSEELLRDIVISFILAGRETTSSTLTWFFWLLAHNPRVERAILDELAPIRAKRAQPGEEEAYAFEELREMQYLHAAISEAMRLYPPVPANSNSSQRDDVLPDGTFVGEGWFVSYNAYAMGRMESIWGKDCLDYRPERWLGEEDGVFKGENPFKYPVFHAGPRTCLGKEMAYIQMKSIAACVIERFVIDVVAEMGAPSPPPPPQQMFSLTLRMKGGLRVRVRERCTGGID
ncbi:Cytochrome P450 94A1 [Acorus gramineus]|uniref:Cytochrome P450 94A1 n=1 Tax=Acorus gramineus TaxID=55184 RepID=A0AAV9BRS2_ACOGR|nr:Cytochrome P450 94A1 [Acorus gramineus]